MSPSSPMIRRIAVPVLILILTSLFSAVSKAQTVINVPVNQATIQAAIDGANNGDTVLVAPGTYTENINFHGKAIVVTSSGGSAVTIIDGGANGAVVTFNTGETAASQLTGFTIRNGFQNGAAGGGILISGASPTIIGNLITGNHAALGIGISVSDGSPVIKNNTITGNDQTGAGSSGQGGGGILVSGFNSISPGAPQILGNTITNNSVANGGSGGGVSVTFFASPTIQGNLIQGNTSFNSGGGMNLQSFSSLAVLQNIIVNNSSLGGGSGAGVRFSPASVAQTFFSNTVAGNTASDGTSGVFVTGQGQNVTFTNNIISAVGAQTAVTCSAAVSSISPFFSFNDAFSPSGLAWAGICDSTSHPGNISADPQFVSATDFHLQLGSLALDAGDNSAPNLPSADFDGNPRVMDGNNDCINIVDLGAYELQATMAAGFFPSSLSFASQLLGTTSSPQSSTLTSSGTTCFQFAGKQITGDFVLQANTCPALGLPAGKSCSFSVAFAPTVLGVRLGSLSVTSTGGSSANLSLTGNGANPAVPVASFSPMFLVFPSQPLTTVSAPQAITLSNVGTAPLTINSVSATGDFAVANGCVSPLNAGASCPINVSFVPSAVGSRTGFLIVSENADSSPQNLALSGTGVDFALTSSAAAATLDRGDTFTFTVTALPQSGSFGSAVAFSCSGVPLHVSCALSPAQVIPGGTGASTMVTLTVNKGRPYVGTFTVTLTGVSGTLSHSIPFQLVVVKH
jgi:hypothetical protein